MCARFLSHLLLLYIGRVHGAISGCTVLCEVHPASAQNKSLISDTECTIVLSYDTGASLSFPSLQPIQQRVNSLPEKCFPKTRNVCLNT